jgi:hypothetical protein
MTELEKAIETISEGGQALGVSCEDVYRDMLACSDLAMNIMTNVHEWNSFTDFGVHFNAHCKELLKEALRTKLEQEAGL